MGDRHIVDLNIRSLKNYIMVNSLCVLLNGDVAFHAPMEVAADMVGKPVCAES